MGTGIVLEGTVRAETVTVDTAAEAEMTTTAAGNDTTRVTRMMIHAANEGISLLGYGIGLLGGSFFALRLSLQHSRVSGVHRTYHISNFQHQTLVRITRQDDTRFRYNVFRLPSPGYFRLGSSTSRSPVCVK
jgi:hypothetical protein